MIDHVIANHAYSFPFSRTLYDELHKLLRMLLEAGHVNICRQFCQISSKTVYTNNPSKEHRWFITVNEQGTCKEIKGDELKTLQNAQDPRLFSLPGVDVTEQYHLDSCILAPFNYQAYIANKAIGWDNHHDAAVVWWYFESALRCWNTPASYFEEKRVNRSDLTEEDFYRLCEKDTWNEIASAKNSELPHNPVVFTDQLFKRGFKMLAHEITAYFSRFATEEAVQKSIKDEIIFELTFGDKDALDPNKDAKNGSLWISITTCEPPTKYFYLKKFNYDSSPWRFAASLLRKYSKGGIVEVELGCAESISKFIEHIGLEGDIKDIFFGRSEENRVPFRGKCVTLKKCAIDNLEDIIEQLLQKHNDAGAPQFQCF